MSQGKIPAKQPLIKFKRVRIDNIVIGEYGFLSIENYAPSGMNNFLFCLMRTFGSVTPSAACGVTSNGNYVYGTAGASISYVIVDYYYTD